MKVYNSYFPSSSGLGNIRVRTWEPEEQPRAVLQLCHGVAEHVERYDGFAAYAVSKGYLVVAGDHLGHGLSAPEKRGWFGESGGWFHVVEDIKRIFDEKHEPLLPYFILGHSMGSFLLRTFLAEYPDAPLSGVVISGTGWQGEALLKAGLAVCRMQGKKLGSDGVSPLINSMAFGSYNKRISNPKSANAWLSRREEVVAAYDNDELCGFPMTVGLARDLFTGIGYIQNAENISKMNKKLPVLFISGDMDPVGGYGKGVTKAAEAFKKAGMESVSVILYPGGRHEMLNETNNRQVYEDVLSFLDSQAEQG